MMNLILIAAPGAGKGTLAKSLKEKYNYVHISTGDLLRDIVKSDDPLGAKIKDILEKGLLVDDELIYEILKKRLSESDCKNGVVLDGFPRNVSQAQKYDEIVKEVGLDLGKVILLDISEELLIKRITGRRLCPDCGAIYNIFNPEICPKEENKCDKCGGTLYQRSDDNVEALKTRYATYVEQTAPLINYYKEKGILSVVDGGMGIDETFEQVKGIIE